MKLLVFSSLYPDATRPRHGIFVETRLRHLLTTGGIEASVIAPVPWFPFSNAVFGAYAAYARVPEQESRNGITVYHPRYLSLPKIGMSLAPWFMARAGLRITRKLRGRGERFDVIDAHYFYPDGVAAALVANRLGVPLVITARGSDLNVLPNYRVPRTWIRWAAQQATHLVTVSRALKKRLLGLGMPEGKVTVLRNGVNTELFSPVDRDAVRTNLELSGHVLLSVGNLVPAKGHDLAIHALARIPGAQLVIIGEGVDRSRLQSLVSDLELAGRVRFVGNMLQSELRDYYGAADVLLLASEREGWPNVLLEAMACGTPVIAAEVGGTPEIVAAPEAGLLLPTRDADALAAAIEHLRCHAPDRAATRRYAESFGWQETSAGQRQIFEHVMGGARS